jgi:Right handed beta helix region
VKEFIMKSRSHVFLSSVLPAVVIVWAVTPTVQAAELCVNAAGGGCYTTIGAAVAAAAPNDVIRVARGTYHEDVVIGKPLSLLGDGAQTTTIDATGLLNGVNVDGYGHPGLGHVIVSGFHVQNANAQGIVVTNAFDVLVSNNHLTGNDRSLNFVALQCPPLPPYFQGGEGFDCGEAIHLSGVNHSIVANNLVEGNAGGILISDDTGPNHDNLITGNTVQDNPFDCGITIASHHFTFGQVSPSDGIYNIVVVGNTSRRNGLVTGEGAGVGIFAGPPGAQNNGNVVSNNVLTDNALPGVAIHAHSPNQSLGHHQIVGNRISGNGPDGDAGTTEPTGISLSSEGPPLVGIVISQNIIQQESIDVAMKTASAMSTVDAHFNSFLGDVGVDNLGLGTISASGNWWKCSGGPSANGCSTVAGSGVTVTPWLSKPF